MTASEKPLECPRCHKQGTVEELMGHTCKEKPWSPDLPLRADATHEQIVRRFTKLESDSRYTPNAIVIIARELASAVSAEKEAELAKWKLVAAEVSLAIAGTDVSTPAAFRTSQAKYATELLDRVAEKDAEIARLRKDAERLDWLEAQVTHPRVVHLQLDPPQGLRDTFTAHVHLNGNKPGPWVQQDSAKGIARAAIDSAREAK